jgi:hypothetical protein
VVNVVNSVTKTKKSAAASTRCGIASKHHLRYLIDLLINKHLTLDQLVQQPFALRLAGILGQCLAARLSLLDSAAAKIFP